jgi:uncharacterized membrane protein
MQATSRRDADGFRERGQQVTRVETFVDAAFAFAVTLLMISAGELPASVEDLVESLLRLPAFAATFAVLVMLWLAHNNWSRRYGLDDPPAVLLSLLLVFVTLVFVYPLRMLFESFFAWISFGALPASFTIGSIDNLRAMFIVYGASFATMSACIAALYWHAWRRRVALGLDEHECRGTLERIGMFGWIVLLSVVSMLSTLLLQPGLPEWTYGMPGMIYFLVRPGTIPARAWARRVMARAVH